MGDAKRRKRSFDRNPADAAFRRLLQAADRQAWCDGHSLDHDAIRVVYDDFIFAADQARQDESPTNVEELAAKSADLTVALGLDRIPDLTARAERALLHLPHGTPVS
jgi:hypothetical protein